jgi:hypothetical protein
MLQPQQVEDLIVLVSSLDKPALMRQFSEYPSSFPIDFTPDFLDRQPLERLRHLFVAVCLQTKQMPLGPQTGPAAAA